MKNNFVFAVLLLISVFLVFYWFNNSFSKYIYNVINKNEISLDIVKNELDEIKQNVNKDILRKQDLSNELGAFYELWNEIFKVSKEQNLVKSEVLIKTLKFMIQEVDEEDPKLIEFVRTLINTPSTKPLNLSIKNRKDFSQIGQSAYMDQLLQAKRNGFFVEAGGYDGETFSNSLYFELEREWTGLLIEPVPSLYQLLVSKNRRVYSINACIAQKKPTVSKFRIYDALSGRFSEMSDTHNKRMGDNYVFIYVPCFSLNTILKAINVKNVDYFSLDLEGGEWDVLSSLDFRKYDIKSFSIEYAPEIERKEKMVNHLKQFNYTLTKADGQDIYLLKQN